MSALTKLNVFSLLFVVIGLAACQVSSQGLPAKAPEKPTAALTQAELRNLASPIALYPDSLIQVMLPAATFPEQIVDASLLIKSSKDAALIQQMDWDPSVKAVSNYPGILRMMSDKLDWTIALGRAFLGQHKELLSSIQALRAEAKEVGNLKSTPENKVVTETAPTGETVIKVEPANPQVIYVPSYDPGVVYSQPSYDYSAAPLVTFGLGMALGSAISHDHDDDVNVYYGGGHGIWYNDDAYDNWADHRSDRWNDVNDYYKDRQDFRQSTVEKGQDFRQDYYKETGKMPRAQQANSGQLSPERQQALNTKKQELQTSRSGGQSGQIESFGFNKEARAGAAAEARTAQNRSDVQQRASSAKSSAAASRGAGSGNAFGGYTSGGMASSYSSRGSYSRGSASQFGGGSRPSGGGFSRGGGGGMRGGGGSRGGGGRRR